MIKVLVLYPWPADTEHFKKHYLEHHLPLCRAIPHTLSIRYAFEPENVAGEKWFCAYEAEYADEASLIAARATPQAKRAADDVPNYSAAPPTILVCNMRAP